MPNKALSQITSEAKRIRKAHPKKTWKAAIQEASKRYKRGTLKKSSPKKRVPPKKRRSLKKAPVKKVRRVGKVPSVGNVPTGTVSSYTGAAVKLLEASLGKLTVRHFNAKTKTEKRSISKAIVETKAQIRKLKK